MRKALVGVCVVLALASALELDPSLVNKQQLTIPGAVFPIYADTIPAHHMPASPQAISSSDVTMLPPVVAENVALEVTSPAQSAAPATKAVPAPASNTEVPAASLVAPAAPAAPAAITPAAPSAAQSAQVKRAPPQQQQQQQQKLMPAFPFPNLSQSPFFSFPSAFPAFPQGLFPFPSGSHPAPPSRPAAPSFAEPTVHLRGGQQGGRQQQSALPYHPFFFASPWSFMAAPPQQGNQASDGLAQGEQPSGLPHGNVLPLDNPWKDSSFQALPFPYNPAGVPYVGTPLGWQGYAAAMGGFM